MNLLPNWNEIATWEYVKTIFTRKERMDFDRELGLAVEAVGIKGVLVKI